MEMLLNDNDIVVGAKFENGTIQDYIDEDKTYGLIRIENSTVNWFLFNKDESEEDIQNLYKKIKEDKHFIENDSGEEIVLFNKEGSHTYEDFIDKVNEYLNDEMGNLF